MSPIIVKTTSKHSNAGKAVDFVPETPEHARSKHSGAADAKSAGRSSFAARSMRSRKLRQEQGAQVEALGEQVKCTVATVDDIRNQVQ